MATRRKIASDYKGLKLYGTVLTILGWVTLSISIFLIIPMIGLLTLPFGLHTFVTGYIVLIGVPLGITWLIMGQAIGCFEAIERNTRQTHELIAEMLKIQQRQTP